MQSFIKNKKMKSIQQFYMLVIALVLTFTSCNNKANKNIDSILAENKTELVNANTQDCDGYYPMSKGISFELTSYDKKDKATAIIKYKIIESKSINNGIVATSEMSISDEKGNPGMEMTFETKCQNGKYYLNLENMFSQLTSQYEAQGMKISIENGISVVPNNLTVNDQLEDTTMLMKMSSTAMSMEFHITFFDRVVIGKETITTSAGTFDCMILSQKTSMKMGEMMTITTSSKEWLSKGTGAIKSESYNEKGKLESYNLLTKFSK